MKIGILTHPLETNYGGILQAFALQTVLRRMGHDAITIDRHSIKKYPSFYLNCLGYTKRLLYYYVYHKDVSISWNPFIDEEEFRVLSSNTQQFIDRNIILSRRVFNDELTDIDEEYLFDAYVVGSDQVWLPQYCPNSFLDFVKRDDVIRIFYAASCGKQSFADSLPLQQKCRILASKFSGISVRENKLLSISEKALDKHAQLVLDPTLLLTPKDYLSVIKTDIKDMSPIVFSYILDSTIEKGQIISKVSNLLNLPHVEGNVKQSYVKGGKKSVDQCIFPPVDDWLYNISRAHFVVTDSFHGTVFSILFNKPFVVIGNTQRGIDRFLSILQMFGLENRIISSIDQLTDSFVFSSINYETVNTIHEQYKGLSINYLLTHLSK